MIEKLVKADPLSRAYILEQLFRVSKRSYEPLLSKLSVWAVLQFETNSRPIKELAKLTTPDDIDFIEWTSPYTIPALVQLENTNLISLLLESSSSNPILEGPMTSELIAKWLLIFTGDIIAHLLLNNVSLSYFQSLMSHLSVESVSIDSLLRTNALQLIYRLVIGLGGNSKLQAEKGISFVAGQLSPNTPIPIFLMHHSLGVIARLQDHLNNIGMFVSPSDKVNIVKAFKVFVTLLGEDAARISAQIAAFLVQVMTMPDLWDVGLDLGLSFLCGPGRKGLGGLVGSLAVEMMRIETKCTPNQRSKLVAIFEFLTSGSEVGRLEFPDVPDTEEWSRVKEKVTGDVGRLDVLAALLTHDKLPLIEQTLVRLKNALLGRTGLENFGLVQRLVSVLRELEGRVEVAVLACECLGIIGAIDPSRMKIESGREVGLDGSMTTGEEVGKFVTLLVQTHLVPLLQATHDPGLRFNLSFTIQELLVYLGFTAEVVAYASGYQPRRGEMTDRWRAFTPAVTACLEPLVGSRYQVEMLLPLPLTYPFFHYRLTFPAWLSGWCLDLIGKLGNGKTRRVFLLLGPVVGAEGGSTAALLIPHLITRILMEGDKIYTEEIRKEFVHVLGAEVPTESTLLVERHRLCVQVLN